MTKKHCCYCSDHKWN